MRTYRRGRDALNSEAEAKSIPFTVFKSDPEYIADKVAAARMRPEDLSGVMPSWLAKGVAPLENGISQMAGEMTDSDITPVRTFLGIGTHHTTHRHTTKPTGGGDPDSRRAGCF